MKSCSISCDNCSYTIQMSFGSHVWPETSVLQIMANLCSLLYLFPFKKLLMCHICLCAGTGEGQRLVWVSSSVILHLIFWDRMFIEYGACYLDQAGRPESPGDPALSINSLHPPVLSCGPTPPCFDCYIHNGDAMPGFHTVVINSFTNEPSPQVSHYSTLPWIVLFQGLHNLWEKPSSCLHTL